MTHYYMCWPHRSIIAKQHMLFLMTSRTRAVHRDIQLRRPWLKYARMCWCLFAFTTGVWLCTYWVARYKDVKGNDSFTMIIVYCCIIKMKFSMSYYLQKDISIEFIYGQSKLHTSTATSLCSDTFIPLFSAREKPCNRG